MGHNVAAASDDYMDRYFNELPRTFNPKRFDPEEWAILAKLAGMKYICFTTKHINGFCMWDTETTDFNIINTGYGKDILAEIIAAFRKYDIAIGLYFCTQDFHVMYKQGHPICRTTPEAQMPTNKELWEITKKQLKEILTNYGKIDILFLDDWHDWNNTLVANYCWDVDPNLVITRGGMPTPEQKTIQVLTEKRVPGPWEACNTFGWHWQYVPGEEYRDTTELINLLIATRANGGNLLLSVGPTANGQIPERQEDRLREIGLWYLANHEAVEKVEPWNRINESRTPDNSNSRMVKEIEKIWFTKARGKNIVYAFIPGGNWAWMERKEFLLRTIKGNENTKVSVLGQNQKVVEYELETDPRIYATPTEEGLFVSVIKSQRLTKTWDNPVVLKIENVTDQPLICGKKK